MHHLLDQELGNYRLLRLLGQGGFAEVYLGEHLHLGTQAAIKVHYARMEGADLARFEQEARVIANLAHSQIVRVLEYGVQDGVAFLVMEYALVALCATGILLAHRLRWHRSSSTCARLRQLCTMHTNSA